MAKFVNQGFSISDLLIWLAVLSVLVTLSLKFIPPYIEHRTALSIVRDLVIAEEAGKMDISALEDRLNKNLKVNSLSKFQQAKRIVLDAQGQTITAKLESMNPSTSPSRTMTFFWGRTGSWGTTAGSSTLKAYSSSPWASMLDLSSLSISL